MGLSSWFSSLFKKPKEQLVAPPTSLQSHMEVRTPCIDPDLQKLLPPDYRIEFVENCQSEFYFDPDKWERGVYSNTQIYDNSGKYAIEVVSQHGKVMAAVGWDTAEDEGCAYTIGTYVAKHLRRRGIAKALWRAMIKNCFRARVHGCAATDEGYTLLCAMREEFPNVVSFQGQENRYGQHEDLRRKAGAA